MINWQVIAGAGVGAFLLGSIAGYQVKSTLYDAAEAKELREAREAHAVELERLQATIDQQRVDRMALAAELEAARANVRTVTREVIREVPKYVQGSTPECDRSISPDLAVLYNRSLGLNAGRAAVATDAARGGAYPVRPVDGLAGGPSDRAE